MEIDLPAQYVHTCVKADTIVGYTKTSGEYFPSFDCFILKAYTGSVRLGLLSSLHECI